MRSKYHKCPYKAHTESRFQDIKLKVDILVQADSI